MRDRKYFRPIVQVDVARPKDAQRLAGGWGWFTHVEQVSRGEPCGIIRAQDMPADALAALTAVRDDIAGLRLAHPQIMGILNTTPDSFSDGGLHHKTADAITAGQAMAAAGADVLDIGGESTRPGAVEIDPPSEISRTAPVIAGLRAAGVQAPISIDTRKANVAKAALEAGANLINDVSGLTFDTALAPLVADRGVPVCIMHGPVDPATMQQNPQYDNVVLDVFDFLDKQIIALEATGVPKSRIIADPGIGFGKTLAHNLALLARLSLFHSLGVPILLGASRKRFIGTIGGAEVASDRAPGSVAVALAALGHGIQMLRVHDVAETKQALSLWRAANTGQSE